MSVMAATFAGSGQMPLAPAIWPRYLTLSLKSCDLGSEQLILASARLWKTRRRWWMCSLKLWLYTRISSMYTSANTPSVSCKTLCISLVNCASRLTSPKETTVYSQSWPLPTRKAVFQLLP